MRPTVEACEMGALLSIRSRIFLPNPTPRESLNHVKWVLGLGFAGCARDGGGGETVGWARTDDSRKRGVRAGDMIWQKKSFFFIF